GEHGQVLSLETLILEISANHFLGNRFQRALYLFSFCFRQAIGEHRQLLRLEILETSARQFLGNRFQRSLYLFSFCLRQAIGEQGQLWRLEILKTLFVGHSASNLFPTMRQLFLANLAYYLYAGNCIGYSGKLASLTFFELLTRFLEKFTVGRSFNSCIFVNQRTPHCTIMNLIKQRAIPIPYTLYITFRSRLFKCYCELWRRKVRGFLSSS